MKYIVASDIHGSAYWCGKLMEAYEKEQGDRLVLLGDILYHGPRNPLPHGHDAKGVIAMLNEKKDEIFAVRGNCDAEVDQMVLQFPLMADYAVLTLGERVVYLTHGHVYNASKLPPMKAGDVLLMGHTHVPCCKEVGEVLVCNPGSVSLPKEDSWHGYLVLDETQLVFKDFDGTVQLCRTLE